MVTLAPDPNLPLVALAFKLEEGRFGQLTYMRVYQGTLKKATFITNIRTGKRIKVPRLVRMHSNEMQDIDEVGPGEICAIFGVECNTGDTFGDLAGGRGVSMVCIVLCYKSLLVNSSTGVDVCARASDQSRYQT